MRLSRRQAGNGQLDDLLQFKGGITQQPFMLRGHLAGAVLELPRGVYQDGRVAAGNLLKQIFGWGWSDSINGQL